MKKRTIYFSTLLVFFLFAGIFIFSFLLINQAIFTGLFTSEPITLDVHLCKDYDCEKITSTFYEGEKIFLSVETQENITLKGEYINPDGQIFSINFISHQAEFASTILGEHKLIITGSNERYGTQKIIYFNIEPETILSDIKPFKLDTTKYLIIFALLLLSLPIFIILIKKIIKRFHLRKQFGF